MSLLTNVRVTSAQYRQRPCCSAVNGFCQATCAQFAARKKHLFHPGAVSVQSATLDITGSLLWYRGADGQAAA